LDVTGDARYSEERDRVGATLKHLQAYDGGMLWDASTSTLTIQMTTEDALQQARLLLLVTSPTWLRVNRAAIPLNDRQPLTGDRAA
jgi:hypothetical protein